MSQVSISPGNSKMGSIPSVSLPSQLTCAVSPCWNKCYAHKLERLRPNVSNAYHRNLELLIDQPEVYWREVEAAVMMSRFFRFHVSGDMPTVSYFIRMVDIAERNPHCQILCFTKRYGFVNQAIDDGVVLPANLHLVFSVWPGLAIDNRFNLPEAHVRFRDGSTTAGADAIECGGNCTECARTDGGCWSIKAGQQVVFNEH